MEEQYCNDCAPFKVGDKIRLNGKEGVITLVEPFLNSFHYYWKQFKKNGELNAYNKMLYSYDLKNIEKL